MIPGLKMRVDKNLDSDYEPLTEFLKAHGANEVVVGAQVYAIAALGAFVFGCVTDFWDGTYDNGDELINFKGAYIKGGGNTLGVFGHTAYKNEVGDAPADIEPLAIKVGYTMDIEQKMKGVRVGDCVLIRWVANEKLVSNKLRTFWQTRVFIFPTPVSYKEFRTAYDSNRARVRIEQGGVEKRKDVEASHIYQDDGPDDTTLTKPYIPPPGDPVRLHSRKKH